MPHLPFVLLTLLISSSLAGPLIRAAGQNGEACLSDADCIGGRICLSTTTRSLCSTGGPEICLCVPPNVVSFCSSSDDCDDGEICVLGAAIAPLLSSTCVSDRLAIPEANFIEFTEDLVLSGGALTPCRTDAQCGFDGARCLLAPFGMALSCASDSPNCACVPDGGLVSCTGAGDCAGDDVCVELTGLDADLIDGAVCADPSIQVVPDFQLVASSTPDEPASNGLTFDRCLANDDCQTGRQCLGVLGPCEGNEGDACACLPTGITLTFCGTDDDCVDGEACAQGSPAQGLFFEGNCVSATFLASEDMVEPFSGNGRGVTLETCVTDGGCTGNLTCNPIDGDECALGQCACTPSEDPALCSSSSECRPRELCVKNTRASIGPSCLTGAVIIPGLDTGFVEQVGNNKTLEPCTNDGDCAGSRSCRTEAFNVLCLPTNPTCVCRPRDGLLRNCTTSDSCPGREVCAEGGPTSVTGGETKCVAESALGRFGLAIFSNEEVPGMPLETPGAEPSPLVVVDFTPSVPPLPGSELLPGDFDDMDDPIMSPPAESPEPGTTPEPDDSGATPEPEGAESGASPSPSPVPFVCVDAGMLEGFSKEELVFEQHAQGSVLCDRDGSCATDGHMVTWRGSGMMMRSYCEVVEGGCERRVMMVNSPRYRKGLRVKSRTEGLLFTAFAAKYATRLEEVGLRTLVRVGL